VFYRGAKQFVIPSKTKGFGILPIESAALLLATKCRSAAPIDSNKAACRQATDAAIGAGLKGYLANNFQ